MRLYKKLILLGGNSSLVENILKYGSIRKDYSETILLCHRNFKGIKNDSTIIENINPINVLEIFTNIFDLNPENKYDILVSNTPTKNLDIKNNLMLEWSLSSLKLMNFFGSSNNVNKAIFLGSVISFIPFYKNGAYKSIKKIEFILYSELIHKNNKKVIFCILPPLSPGIRGLGKLFAEPKSYWAKKLLSEFNTKENKIIMSSKLIGIILKIILALRKIKL